VRAERSRGDRDLDPHQASRDNPRGMVPEPVTDDPSPLERLERVEVAQRVMAAMDRLPARYRVPLALYHIDGLSHAKVARTLGVPEGTVRSLVARARRKLSRVLSNAPEVRDMADASRAIRDAMDVLDDEPSTTPRLLHVLNGDSVRMTLEHSDVPGAFAPYADILHEGPVPRASGSAAWRETRARFLVEGGYGTYAEALRTYEQWDASLAAFADYDEVVLWFEHDLFDQLLLLRHLDWFSHRDLGTTTLSLICIGEFPGFDDFHGLGELDADPLASLLGTRQRVSAGQLALGRRGWQAFTASVHRRSWRWRARRRRSCRFSRVRSSVSSRSILPSARGCPGPSATFSSCWRTGRGHRVISFAISRGARSASSWATRRSIIVSAPWLQARRRSCGSRSKRWRAPICRPARLTSPRRGETSSPGGRTGSGCRGSIDGWAESISRPR